jgi:hypothetical protein
LATKKVEPYFSESDIREGKMQVAEWLDDPNGLVNAFRSLKDNRRYDDWVITYGLHTCGAADSKYPFIHRLKLHSPDPFQMLTEAHKSALDQLYESVQFDLGGFNLAKSTTGNLWPYRMAKLNLGTSAPGVESVDMYPYFDVIAPGEHEKLVELVRDPSRWPSINYEGWRRGNVTGGRVSSHTTPNGSHTLDQNENLALAKEYIFVKFCYNNFVCRDGETSICVVCRNRFDPDTEVKLARLGMPGKVCAKCQQLFGPLEYTTRSKSHLWAISVFAVKNFINIFGAIPTANKNLNPWYESEFAQLSNGNLRLAFFTLKLLPLEKIGFDSWSQILEAAGVLEGKIAGYGGYQSIATDGHHCLSAGERTVCEYLTSNGIAHEKESKYPVDPLLNPKGLMRCDFQVGYVIIEYAGRLDHPEYADRIIAKRELAEKTGHVFVEVNPGNVKNLDFILEAMKTTPKRKR